MAYVDQAFSITDDDLNMDDFSPYTLHSNRPPIKEIALAVSLLVFGTLAIISGVFMSIYQIGDDRAHGVFFAILGSILFIPGFYYTRIAYYAYKGYKELIVSHSGNMPETFVTEISMSQRTNTSTWRKGDDSKKLLL